MNPKKEYFRLWRTKSTSLSNKSLEERMVMCLEAHLRKNYPTVQENKQKIVLLKKDFESDLLPTTVAEAVGCDIETVNLYRYDYRRGVVRTGKAERDDIPRSKRTDVLERDDYECVRCGAQNHAEDLQLHHIIPKKHGGLDFVENLAYLCPDCHLEAHCGDYSKGRIAYDNPAEFWNTFTDGA